MPAPAGMWGQGAAYPPAGPPPVHYPEPMGYDYWGSGGAVQVFHFLLHCCTAAVLKLESHDDVMTASSACLCQKAACGFKLLHIQQDQLSGM